MRELSCEDGRVFPLLSAGVALASLLDLEQMFAACLSSVAIMLNQKQRDGMEPRLDGVAFLKQGALHALLHAEKQQVRVPELLSHVDNPQASPGTSLSAVPIKRQR